VTGDIVTKWGVVFVMEVEQVAPAGDVRSLITTGDVFARAQRAYLDRCPVLRAFLDAEAAEVRVVSKPPGSPGDAGPSFAGTPDATETLVGVSVVEVRPSSFDMAVRIRRTGEGEHEPVNMRRTLVLERTATGERLPVPREVRAELIAIQLAARDTC
jgi:hypothetical protein